MVEGWCLRGMKWDKSLFSRELKFCIWLFVIFSTPARRRRRRRLLRHFSSFVYYPIVFAGMLLFYVSSLTVLVLFPIFLTPPPALWKFNLPTNQPRGGYETSRVCRLIILYNKYMNEFSYTAFQKLEPFWLWSAENQFSTQTSNDDCEEERLRSIDMQISLLRYL